MLGRRAAGMVLNSRAKSPFSFSDSVIRYFGPFESAKVELFTSPASTRGYPWVGTIHGGTNQAARRAKQLLAEAQSQLSEQAAQQQQKVAGGLESRCLCSVVWVSTGAQPDQVGVDVVMLDFRSDRNDGQGVTQELLEVRVIGEQQGVRVGG